MSAVPSLGDLQRLHLKLSIAQLQSVLRREGAEESKPPEIELLSIEDIIHQPDPEWLIEGWLQAESLVSHYGPSDSGKSFVAIAMACCVASNIDWLWSPTQHGDVVYVYAEGGAGIAKRVRAWCQATKRPFPPRLHGIPHAVNMLDQATVEALIAEIKTKKIAPRLIVLDTLARCFGDGDENSTKDMNAFVTGCDELRHAFPGCTLHVVHHTGYDTTHSRGSSAFKAAADIELAQQRVGTGTGRLKKVKLVTAKMKNFTNDHDTELPLYLEAVTIEVPEGGGLPATKSAVMRLSEPPTAEERANPNEQKVLEVLGRHPEGMEPRDLRRDAGIDSPNTFKDVLKRLIEKRRKVIKEADRYLLAPSSDE